MKCLFSGSYCLSFTLAIVATMRRRVRSDTLDHFAAARIDRRGGIADSMAYLRRTVRSSRRVSFSRHGRNMTVWSHPAFGTSLLGPRTKRRFFVLYATRFAGGIACYTQEEVGEAVGLFRQDVAKAVEAQKMEDLPKSAKLLRS